MYSDQARGASPYPAAHHHNKLAEPTISTCIEDFDPVIERAMQYANRLQRVLEKVRGEMPADKTLATDPISPSHSILSSINMRRSHLAAALDRIERIVDGLETSI